jgi:Ca2+-binding RTX toxin-like protein
MCQLCQQLGLDLHKLGTGAPELASESSPVTWAPSSGGSAADAESPGTGSANAGQPTGTIPQLADYLITGYWQSNGAIAHHWGSNAITFNLGDLNATEQTIALAALNLWHDVANVTFVQTTGSANINFNHDGSMLAATNSFWDGSGIMSSATIDISSDWVTTYGIGLGTYSYQTYIHEIGHALGLGHQGHYNGSGTYGIDNVYANDTWQYSVMSYFDQSNYGGASYRFVMTPMMADIYAVDSVYGAATTRTGDTVYGFNSNAGSIYDFASYGTAPALTIYDSGGTDTLDCSGYGQNQVIDLNGGSFSNIGGLIGNICIYTTSVIENAIGGSGNDTITGNAADNVLNGGAGNDTLVGGAGADVLIGGVGDDTYVVDNAGDVVTEKANEGTDTVQTTLANYTLGANVENLTFTDNGTHTGSGNALDNVLTGGSGNDSFFAGAGSDIVNGGDGDDTLVGHDTIFDTVADVLNGGNGNDTIYAGASDTIQGGAGHDVLYIVNSNPININLGATGIEYIQSDFGNDVIDGSSQTVGIEVYSDGGNDTITGSAFNDIIWSGSGNDTVTGGDGNDVIVADIGTDNVSGGNGNDSLYVDSSDTVDGGAGFDAVYITGGTGMSINMAATNVEWVADFVGGNDTINGSGSSVALEVYAGGGTDTVTGGSGSDFLWGGAGNDTITGNSGDDTLVGEAGADTLTGGLGTDALYGNSGNGGDGAVDTFVFTNNWGTDFVFDFEDGTDKLDMSALGITFADLTITDTPDGHAHISYQGNLISVANAAGHIDQTDFIF